MAKQSFTYLFRLRSTCFDLGATTTDDAMAFDTKDAEGMGWGW
jgi:hypothetical protein